MGFLRNAFNFPDENAFVTIFIIQILYDVEKIVSVPFVNIENVKNALIAIQTIMTKISKAPYQSLHFGIKFPFP